MHRRRGPLGATSAECAVEFRGVLMQPAPPRSMVRPARRHERPERGAVAEHPEVSEFMHDDGIEGLGRCQDQAPRKGESAGT